MTIACLDYEDPADAVRAAFRHFVALTELNMNMFSGSVGGDAPSSRPDQVLSSRERVRAESRQANARAAALRQFLNGNTTRVTESLGGLMLSLAGEHTANASPSDRALFKPSLQALQAAVAEASGDGARHGHSLGAMAYTVTQCGRFAKAVADRLCGGSGAILLRDHSVAQRITYDLAWEAGTTEAALRAVSKFVRGLPVLQAKGLLSEEDVALLMAMAAQRGGGRLSHDHARHHLAAEWFHAVKAWGAGSGETAYSRALPFFQFGYFDQQQLRFDRKVRERTVIALADCHALLPVRPNGPFQISVEHGYRFHVALQHALLSESLDVPLLLASGGAFAGRTADALFALAMERPAPGQEATGLVTMASVRAGLALDFHGLDRAIRALESGLSGVDLALAAPSALESLALVKARLSAAGGSGLGAVSGVAKRFAARGRHKAADLIAADVARAVVK
ncbi:hypothetical protein [Bosea sp. MMO-172]|uniref:hypothetical protein n=1 Tax=Bosea sp. MMO-172 TaxID=3127885 RepID=UPI003019BAB6